jgi:hypothetical protein
MRNSSGEAIFCPGCPNAGDYVGGITEDNVSVQTKVTDRTLGLLPHGNFVIVGFTDTDGLPSNPVSTRNVGAESPSLSSARRAVEENREKIIRRIGDCAGRYSKVRGIHGTHEVIHCPALNSAVLDSFAGIERESQNGR